MRAIILCTIFTLLAVCNNSQASDTQAIKIGNDEIKAIRTHEINSQLNYSIDIEYPQISGNHLDAGAMEFNQAVKDRVQQNIAALKQRIGSPVTHSIDNHLIGKFHIQYDVAVIKPHNIPLISIRFTIYDQPPNVATDMIYHSTLNYEIKNGMGKSVSLSSLFTPGSNYAAVMSDYYSRKLLESKGITQNDVRQINLNSYNWNFRQNGLLLTFDNMPVKGVNHEVLIPYKVLATILSSSSPVSICANNPDECK